MRSLGRRDGRGSGHRARIRPRRDRLGAFSRGSASCDGGRIRPSDVILGIPARGFHANGLTLLRRLINEKRVELLRPRPGGRTAHRSRTASPTRIYVRASEAVAPLSQVHGMAHISGGGVRNLARLGIGVGYRLDKWPQPRGVTEWVASLGQLTMEELYQTFNMGIGFVIVVARAADAGATRVAEAGFADAQPVGEVESWAREPACRSSTSPTRIIRRMTRGRNFIRGQTINPLPSLDFLWRESSARSWCRA